MKRKRKDRCSSVGGAKPTGCVAVVVQHCRAGRLMPKSEKKFRPQREVVKHSIVQPACLNTNGMLVFSEKALNHKYSFIIKAKLILKKNALQIFIFSQNKKKWSNKKTKATPPNLHELDLPP